MQVNEQPKEGRLDQAQEVREIPHWKAKAGESIQVPTQDKCIGRLCGFKLGRMQGDTEVNKWRSNYDWVALHTKLGKNASDDSPE